MENLPRVGVGLLRSESIHISHHASSVSGYTYHVAVVLKQLRTINNIIQLEQIGAAASTTILLLSKFRSSVVRSPISSLQYQRVHSDIISIRQLGRMKLASLACKIALTGGSGHVLARAAFPVNGVSGECSHG